MMSEWYQFISFEPSLRLILYLANSPASSMSDVPRNRYPRYGNMAFASSISMGRTFFMISIMQAVTAVATISQSVFHWMGFLMRAIICSR